MATKGYHTFLSHNSADKTAVEELARRLKQEGIEPWLDKWNLVPGEPWQPKMERALAACDTCTVFIGPSGMGPWQHEEMRAAIDRQVSERSGYRVIPVLLPGAGRPERSKLPAFLTARGWAEFRGSLDDEEAFRRLVCGIRGIEPGPSPEEPVYEGVCPYRGLQRFEAEHAPFFFGREALTDWLLHELRPAPDGRENRFLAIIGPSGSGKSSLARAGLIPALKHGKLDGSQDWPVVIFRPGPDPVESLGVSVSADSVIKDSVSSVRAFISDLREDKRTLHLVTRSALHSAPETRRALLLVDQFEEIFTLCQDDSFRRAVIDNLLYASSVAQGQTIVVLTMRADFYAKCAPYDTLAAALSDHQVLVGPMSEDELHQAIERPAQLVGCEFEPGLVETFLQDVKGQPGALPLLEHALTELWEKRKGRRLTHAAYEAIGGLDGALERRANQIFSAFDKRQKEICQRIFKRLIRPGEGIEDTKRRASFDELLPQKGRKTDIRKVIKILADQRLITTEGGKDKAEQGFVEIAHEALIHGWSQLRKWIDSDRDAIRTRNRLTEAARDWEHHNRNPDFLDRGARLLEAEEWSQSYPGELSDLEQEFLHAGVELRDKEKRQEEKRQEREREALRREAQSEKRRAKETETRREEQAEAATRELALSMQVAQKEKERADEAERRRKEQAEAASRLRRRALIAAVAGSAAILLFALALVLFLTAQAARNEAVAKRKEANAQRHSAERQKRIATAGRLAAQADYARDTFPQQSVLLAVEAVNATSKDNLRVPSAEQALRDSLAICGGYGLSGHEGSVRAVAISADKHWLVTGSDDNTARLWDLTVKDSSKEPKVLQDHHGKVVAVAISPNSHWLVTASLDNTARLWDLTAEDPSKASTVLSDHEGSINALAISPDDRWLVTGSADDTARLWHLTADDPSKTSIALEGHGDKVVTVAISPDGDWLVTGSWDNTARLWDLTADDPSETSIVLEGHGDKVVTMAISPDKEDKDKCWLVTGSKDNTARIWDLRAEDPSKACKVLRGHEDFINAAAIGSDNQWLVTGSKDKTARLWDLTTKDPFRTGTVLGGHSDEIGAVAISSNNRWLVTGSDDKTARLWELTAEGPSKAPIDLRGHEERITCVAISPDNGWLATGSADKTTRLWDLTAEDPSDTCIVLEGHGEKVVTVVISPDSHWLVTGSDDKTARLWDLNAKDPSNARTVFRGHGKEVIAVAISPDNRRLVTGSLDKTARLWELTAKDPSKESLVLRGHDDFINSVAISPDNHWLVTGSLDGTARLWDLTAKDPSKASTVMRGHTDEIWAVAVSPDSHWLVTGSLDKTARLWDLTAKEPSKASTVMRGHTDEIWAVAISLDNRWLATGSADNTTRLWNLTDKEPSKGYIVLRGHDEGINAVAISPDSHWLVTGSSDFTARLWTLRLDEVAGKARRVAGRNLTRQEWDQYFTGEQYRKTFSNLP